MTLEMTRDTDPRPAHLPAVLEPAAQQKTTQRDPNTVVLSYEQVEALGLSLIHI